MLLLVSLAVSYNYTGYQISWLVLWTGVIGVYFSVACNSVHPKSLVIVLGEDFEKDIIKIK